MDWLHELWFENLYETFMMTSDKLTFYSSPVAVMRLYLVWLSFFFASLKAESEVTCMSVVKLKNDREGVMLHSHDVKYGSGSGQQSVTGMVDEDDVNSHWQILPAQRKSCSRGEPIKCGEKIRLHHLSTGCYLHSHMFPAPLSRGYQEVSCFGNNDESDSGDNWIVVCNTDDWYRDESVKLKHDDTGYFLATSGEQYGRPISGQREVVAMSSPNSAALWRSVQGVYMVKAEDETENTEEDIDSRRHVEL
ncbi:hypothetical protein AB6A40_003438 [Gnathostoma spinigerum]|uniref:MIR domain-containing protein n=1 Tax=Gnathostoma spinigerum TaxID=75299 RepID=A0ABD6EHB1_9BILA